MGMTRLEHSRGQRCSPCPEECLQCDGNGTEPIVKPKYTFSPTGTMIWARSLQVNTSRFSDDGRVTSKRHTRQLVRSLFLCPVDGEACEGTLGSNWSNTRDGNLVACAPGHGGVLCGMCMSGWKGSFNALCAVCPEVSAASGIFMVVMILIGLLAAVALYKRVVKANDSLQERLTKLRQGYAVAHKALAATSRIEGSAEVEEEEHEEGTFQSLVETLKIVVSNVQIIAQFPQTMKFTCPACDYFKAMLEAMPAVNLDVLNLASFDCIAELNLYSRFFAIVLSPLVICVLVQVRARRSGIEERIHDANHVCFLIIFLTYPTVSSTIFTMFSCRELDMGQSFHVYDTSIDCNGGVYRFMFFVAVVFLVLLPIGVPVTFGILLYKNRERLDPDDHGRHEMTFDVFEKMVKQIASAEGDQDVATLETAAAEGSQLHVRGIGGQFESEGALSEVFSKFGTFVQATVRHRRTDEHGVNTSWALVTMGDSASAARALSASAVDLPPPLTVALFSQKQADKSTGAMNSVRKKAAAEVESRLDLQKTFEEIDADGSGQISLKELVIHALPCHSDPTVSVAKDTDTPTLDEAIEGHEPWWFGGQDEFRFLVKAFEPEFYW